MSKGRNSGITKYINLELSGNDKRDDRLAKKAIFTHAATTTIFTATNTATTKTTASVASAAKAENIEMDIRGNVEEKVELKHNILWAYISLIEPYQQYL